MKSELIEILEELFAIGGNHDILKALELRRKLKVFLNHDEQLLGDQNSENVVIAKDAIRFIDANNTYANTSSVVEAGRHLNSFFDRLLNQEKWNRYELKIFIGSSHLTKDVEQAIRLGVEAIIKFVEFYDDSRTGVLEGLLSCNICSRILHAKYFDDVDEKYFLSSEFKKWFSRLRHLAQEHEELELSNLVTKVRYALFEKNDVWIIEHMQELENYDKKIVDLINREIHFYRTSKRYRYPNAHEKED